MNDLVDIAQLGARMHYAVPAIVANQNRLGTFFTDMWIQNNSTLNLLSKLPINFLNRLQKRSNNSIPSKQVVDFPKLGIDYARKLRTTNGNREVETELFLHFGSLFQKQILDSKKLGAPILYAFNTVAKDLFSSTQTTNTIKVLEQTLVPRITEHRLLLNEFESNSISLSRGKASEAYEQLELDECRLADKILVGSSFVKTALIDLGISDQKIKIVPYGFSPDNISTQTPKVLGSTLRILFVGNGGIRKGLKYALEAISTLKNVQFSIAGIIEPTLVKQYESNPSINFLGSVSRSEMADLYTFHDVLLLPSLCEGSATVSYEAMAYGLPVLCTPNSGTVIENAYNGFLFPIQDSEAIKDVITSISTKKSLLEELSMNALNTAKLYTVEEYGKRLLKAIS